ncbi:MAG TPA: protein kinase, partial [Kofleriaceae bacterium]|nr:protein kinase [Kofleriaceae bacterium]
VDQLNMVLNFGGPAKVLTVVAPHTCPSCGVESGETMDVLAERANLAKGGLPEKECARCGGKLEFDETPESYFAFVKKYAAPSIQPAAAQLLASLGLYTATSDVASSAEKPPRIIKLVHGSVTYFRIIGTIGSMFRARPFLVGAEGEVVIDLAEVDRFDSTGQKEWRRLLKSLAGQVSAVTLVDVSEAFLAAAADTLTLARNIAVASVLVPYGCIECLRTSHESVPAIWPLQFGAHVCATCGGSTGNRMSPEALAPLQKASTTVPPASAKVISQRDEILSRALIDASVAQAGDNATPAVAADDTILGKYKIVRRLSTGGMAEVFLAKQVGIGGFEKPVALKRIQRKLLETRHLAIELFLNEAKIAGRLMHPNIVQVLDVGEVAGALYLAMEYVHGKDLGKVIKRLQQSRAIMPLGEACHVVREVAQALDHAYWSTDLTGKRLSVVHRDISPQNVILSYDGTVKLLDFGVAVSAVTEQAETMIVGKWLYMSPETTQNDQVDHRSDLFSLGVILYLLCSGYMPFTGRDPREIVKKIRAGQYKPLQEIVSIPERLAHLVARMLAPNPDDRPQRGQEVAAELTDIARQYGIESSGPSIAHILKQLFPNEGGASVEPQAPTVREIISGPPSGSYTAQTGSQSGPVSTDASVSFAPRGRDTQSPRVRAASVPPPPPRTREASTMPPPVRPREPSGPLLVTPRTRTSSMIPAQPAPPRTRTSSMLPAQPASPRLHDSSVPPRLHDSSVPPRLHDSSVPPMPGRSRDPSSIPPMNVSTSIPPASPAAPAIPMSMHTSPSQSRPDAPPTDPSAMRVRAMSPVSLVITIGIVVLLAVGMYLLVKPA